MNKVPFKYSRIFISIYVWENFSRPDKEPLEKIRGKVPSVLVGQRKYLFPPTKLAKPIIYGILGRVLRKVLPQ